MISLYAITLIITALYLYFSVHAVKESSIMNRENSQGFKGLMALLIVFAHVSHEYTFPFSTEGKPYGMVVVGLFFFFSGYGLMKQYIVRGYEYTNGFLIKRSGKLLPSFILVLCIAISLDFIADIQVLEVGGGKIGYILVPNSWYVYVLFYYYILFVISTKFIANPKSIVYVLIGCTFLLIFITYIIGLGDWWWKSSFSFNVGTLLPIFERKYGNIVTLKMEKKIFCTLFVLISICIIPNIFVFGFQKFRTLLLIILTTFLPLFLYFAFKKIAFKNHKIPSFLGSISYEVYLLHGVVLTVVLNIIPDTKPVFSIAIIYFVTIVLALPISKASKLVKVK